MTDKIIFLCNLNKELKQIEKEVIDRAITCLEIAEKKLKTNDAFTTDYEIEAEVQYYIENGDDPIYGFSTIFNYDRVVVKKDYGMLLDNGNGTDWHREGGMPTLDEPYCYLLHDLIDHSDIGDKVYEIEMIWVDIIYTDQKGIKINKDWSSKKLRKDGDEGWV